MSPRTREKQTVIVRGIAGAIQAMNMPTFENLKELLNKFGWELRRIPDEQTNQQSKNKE